jgi:hypothetical protein
MKRHCCYLIVSLILIFFSCKKNDLPPSYDTSKITVNVLDASSNAAIISITAKDVKEIGIFKIGICYSMSTEPSVLNDHIELNVNSDTLSEANLDMFYLLTNLTKAEDYYLRGYIKIGDNIFYSAEKTFKTTNNTLTIDVSYNYIPFGKEYWIVLSDKSTTLLTQKLENGQTYTFSDNIPDLADFHLFKWDPTNNKLYVESYEDIVPDEFYLDNPYNSTYLGQVNVTVSDISNFLEWGVASSWWWNTTTSDTTHTLTTLVSKNPDDLFINYIPSDGSAPMFKSVDNVTPSSNYTYTMADFTALTNFANVTLPANDFFTYTLAGFNTDYYTEFKKYHGYSYSTGYSGTFKLYYPTGINTNYYLYTFYNTATQQSFYNKIGSLPATYFSPFPAITINNSSQFKTTTSGIDNYSTYEVMDICGMYLNAGLNIQWDYYKEPQLSNSVQIPEFPDELKLKINNLTTNDLSFSDVGYFDILNSEVDSYISYVDLLIKQSERFYDVVKERRYYFQWVNKKSFESTTKSYNLQDFQH